MCPLAWRLEGRRRARRGASLGFLVVTEQPGRLPALKRGREGKTPQATSAFTPKDGRWLPDAGRNSP